VLGGITRIDLMWPRAELYVMYIEIINRDDNHWLQYERNENDGGL
jgi:hypothetical protein